MNRNPRLMLLAIATLLLCILPALAQQQPAEPPTRPAPKPVTLDLKNVPLDEAINRVIAATNVSVIIAGALPKEPRVTMRMTNVDPVMALQSLATAGNILFQSPEMERGPEGSRWLNSPVLLIPRFGNPAFGPGPRGPGGPQPAPSAPAASAPPLTGAPIATNIAVDLNVKDAPFREAIAQIAKQIPSSSRVRVVVDESVPKDLRVTARLSKMPLNWVIDSLVQQAGLTYGIQDEPDPQIVALVDEQFRQGLVDPMTREQRLADAPRFHIVYIVPKPELHVSGSAGG